ncbi:Predicted RNA-binding protein, contains TRAM domain [Haladaptatus litoreus]|uniref:Predicted RNA-binding protein, contains TRAM domain n=1 Tax=Haladaptatus litoreus TaxID=553468 RepID=A0A1N7F975_9EURY|nr:TRAM domain-containing protein [Haladaptatus litoreus]SIR96775.1 Predicted RNA-binding protein, contains TRAM domain [Haladaptatus litoreus]
MEIPDQLRCLFSSEIKAEDGSYTFTVPSREIEDGDIQPDGAYRVAILKQPASADSPARETAPSTTSPSTRQEQKQDQQSNHSTAPVEEGDRRTVEIEDVGEQGDGIARVERGYVIIVPDTEKRDRVTIEIDNVTPTVAFAEVVERKAHYE